MAEALTPWEDLLNLETFTQDDLNRLTVEEQRKIKEDRYGAYLGSDLKDSIVLVMRHRDDIGETTQEGAIISFETNGLTLIAEFTSSGEALVSADLHGTPIIRDDDTSKLFIPGKWLEDPFRKLDQEAAEYKAAEPVREQQEVRDRFATEILEPQPPPPVAGGTGASESGEIRRMLSEIPERRRDRD